MSAPPISCPALDSMFTIAWPAPLSCGLASHKTIYLNGAPMIVTIPVPIKQPATINNKKLLGYIAIAIRTNVKINVPTAIILREPAESRILPSIGAATALAPKIGMSIRLANCSFRPIERITSDGMNIADEYIIP